MPSSMTFSFALQGQTPRSKFVKVKLVQFAFYSSYTSYKSCSMSFSKYFDTKIIKIGELEIEIQRSES